MIRRFNEKISEMMGFLGRPTHLMGVDVGTNAIKIVQLTRGRQGPKLVYAGVLELDEPPETRNPEKVSEDLRAFLADKPIEPQAVAMAITDRTVTIRHLSLPSMPAEELREAVQWEARKLISEPGEEMIVDYLTLSGKNGPDGKESGKNEHLVVVVNRKVVTDHVAIVQRAGLKVAVVDVNPLVILNILRLNYEGFLGESILFVDLGAHSMDIGIAKKGELCFTRNLPTGMELVTKAIQKGTGLAYAEAAGLNRRYGVEVDKGELSTSSGGRLDIPQTVRESIREILESFVLEIQRSIDFYHTQFRGERIRKIILTGGGVLIPGFHPYLSSYFDIEVIPDNPFLKIHYDPMLFGGLVEMAPRFSSAVGLALRPAGV
jgi:type IV pilus assembly protein PilM